MRCSGELRRCAVLAILMYTYVHSRCCALRRAYLNLALHTEKRIYRNALKAVYAFCAGFQPSFKFTARLNTKAPGFESTISGVK
jgi:hypothetical protein